jgi:large subunit ribosomal protein L23
MSTVAAKKEAAPQAKAAGKAKKTASKGGVIADARLYDVIVRPHVTEKTTRAAEQNKVVFAISPTATKNDVKAAVEAIFKVTVTKVNTINVEGKMKKFRGRDGQRSDLRKAIVTLAAGQSIDFAAGAR